MLLAELEFEQRALLFHLFFDGFHVGTGHLFLDFFGPRDDLEGVGVGTVFEQREPGVEEKVEALDTHAVDAREQVVAELMYGYEQHECQD